MPLCDDTGLKSFQSLSYNTYLLQQQDTGGQAPEGQVHGRLHAHQHTHCSLGELEDPGHIWGAGQLSCLQHLQHDKWGGGRYSAGGRWASVCSGGKVIARRTSKGPCRQTAGSPTGPLWTVKMSSMWCSRSSSRSSSSRASWRGAWWVCTGSTSSTRAASSEFQPWISNTASWHRVKQLKMLRYWCKIIVPKLVWKFVYISLSRSLASVRWEFPWGKIIIAVIFPGPWYIMPPPGENIMKHDRFSPMVIFPGEKYHDNFPQGIISW